MEYGIHKSQEKRNHMKTEHGIHKSREGGNHIKMEYGIRKSQEEKIHMMSILKKKLIQFKTHLTWHTSLAIMIFIISIIGLSLGAAAYSKASKDFNLKKGSVTNDILANNSITSDKLASNIITTRQINPTEVLIVSGVESQNALSLESGNGKDISVFSEDAIDIDATGVISINSSSGVINLGNDANAQNINVGTGTAARSITLGNVTGATGVNLNSGTAGITMVTTGTGDLTITSADMAYVDAVGGIELNSTGGNISLGNDADANSINVGTGAAARTITIGNVTGATGVVINSGTAGISLRGHIMTTETVVAATDPAPTAIESGKVFLIPTIGATTITLPSPTSYAGLRYEFIVSGTVSGDVTIDCGFGLLYGQVLSAIAITQSISTTGKRYVTFPNSGVSSIGDSCVLTTNGVFWFAKCFCSTGGGITLDA